MNRKERRAQKSKGQGATSAVADPLFQAQLKKAHQHIVNNETAAGSQILAQLLRQQPQNTDVMELLARASEQLENFDSAIQFYEAARELQPDKHIIDVALGNLYIRKGEEDKGAALLEKASKKLSAKTHKKDKAIALFHLSNYHLHNGERDKFIDLLNQSLKLNPHYIDALYNAAHYIKKIDNEDHQVFTGLKHVEEQLLDTLNDENKAMLHYALYSAYEQLGRYDEAFEYAQKAARIKTLLHSHSQEETRRTIQKIKTYFDCSFFEEKNLKASPSKVPIFIYGTPRSGTTLLEQILHAHPDIKGVGEDSTLNNIIQRYAMMPERDNTSFPLRTHSQDKENLKHADIAEHYVDHMAQETNNAARVVNKSIGNVLYHGYYTQLFPNAKHIHIIRGALDCCLSCYTHNFTAGGHHYTYDLENMGHYYKEHAQLMQHWKDTSSAPIHAIRYEDLVDDPETHARAILEYLELPWDDACLEFYKSRERIYTASTMQVRQPINKKGIGRWKNYEKHLGPLIEALGNYAEI